ncbi:MAG: hypothetical protein ACOVS5_07470 [Oligoflexus sp.]|jgi:hypothetical protein
MNFTLSPAYFEKLGWNGIISLYDKYKIIVQLVGTAAYGTVRAVVWELGYGD